MKLKIEINLDNAAFDGGERGPAAAHIVEKYAKYFLRLLPITLWDISLLDDNGNTVGHAKVTGIKKGGA